MFCWYKLTDNAILETSRDCYDLYNGGYVKFIKNSKELYSYKNISIVRDEEDGKLKITCDRDDRIDIYIDGCEPVKVVLYDGDEEWEHYYVVEK